MLSIVILVCAANIERADCTQQTALAVTQVPSQASVASVAACGLDAQSLAASRLQIEHGQYVKVLCRRGGGKVVARLSADH